MTDELIISYLLGDLTDEELEQFEEDCFAADHWPEQISVVEETLIEAYLRDDLPAQQRQLFQKNYVITEARQERVLHVAALLRCVDQSAVVYRKEAALPDDGTWMKRLAAAWTSRTLPLRVAMTFAAFAVIALISWFILQQARSPRANAELTLVRNVANDRNEGARAAKVKLGASIDKLKISLALPAAQIPGPHYRVELETHTGDKRTLAISGQTDQLVLVTIPASDLSSGLYSLKLIATNADGTEEQIAKYFFTVE